MCGVFFYWRNQGSSQELTAEAINKELDKTIALARVLTVSLALWVAVMLRYAEGAQIVLLAFFTWTTAVSISASLAYLPTAFKAIMGIASIPFTVSIIAFGEPVLAISLILFATFGFMFIRLLLQHYTGFTEEVSAKIELQEKNDLAEEAHQEVQRIALSDTLTGLPNRRAFFLEVEEQTEAAKKAGTQCAVGIIDLNGFKPINDVFGHRAGDAVLVAVGARLTQTIGHRGMIARLGGDEFGIVVKKYNTQADLLQLGAELTNVLRQPYEFEFSTAMLSGSCGFTIYPESGQNPDTLLDNADTALYQAKKSRSRGAVIYSPAHREEIRERAAIEQALRHAIVADSIELAYQPIIDLSNGEVVAFEALARWEDLELGTIQPDKFIEIAEQTGLIVELTDQLLRKALKAAVTWPQDIELSFNLSAILLVRVGYSLSMISTLNTSGFSPRRLHLEITETALMSSFELARKNIDQLQMAGIRIALDDFGTGYASFGYLDEITVDKLKIDRSFVPGTGMPTGKRQILKAIIGLSAGLGIPTIQEGIETPEQLAQAIKVGCSFGQGFLFSRPMQADKIEDFLARHDAKSYCAQTMITGAETKELRRAQAR